MEGNLKKGSHFNSLSLSLFIRFILCVCYPTVNDKLQKELTITLAEKENQFQQQVTITMMQIP